MFVIQLLTPYYPCQLLRVPGRRMLAQVLTISPWNYFKPNSREPLLNAAPVKSEQVERHLYGETAQHLAFEGLSSWFCLYLRRHNFRRLPFYSGKAPGWLEAVFCFVLCFAVVARRSFCGMSQLSLQSQQLPPPSLA